MLSDILLHPAIIMPSAICLLLPWNVYIRLCLWVGFAFAGLFVLVSFEDFDGYAVIGFIFLLFCATVILVPAGCAQYLLRWAIVGQRPQFAPHPSDRSFLWALGAFGIVTGFLISAFFMPETASAFARHAVFFAFAALCTYRRRFVLAGVAIIAPAFSLYHSSIVRNAATEAAEGSAYCIYLNQRKEFVQGWQQLTFLTMDKGDFSPHAYIIIATDPPTYGYWSYTQQKFDTTWRTQFADPSLTCPTD